MVYLINKNKKRTLGSHPVLSVFTSTTLSLFVFGLLGILLIQMNKISSTLKDNIKVYIYLNNAISKLDLKKLKDELSNKKYILRKNGIPIIEYVSKEKAASDFIKKSNENFWEVLEHNPLKDMIIVGIDHKFQSKNYFLAIKKQIEDLDNVYEVNYAENLASYLNKNLYKIQLILWFFSIILFVSVIFLINNTIKLALYSQRFLIRSMQLVGAFPSFIKKPFVERAAVIGLGSGILASILILVILSYINTKSETLANLQDAKETFLILFSTILIGISVDVLATYFSINKYLKMSLDDLY